MAVNIRSPDSRLHQVNTPISDLLSNGSTDNDPEATPSYKRVPIALLENPISVSHPKSYNAFNHQKAAQKLYEATHRPYSHSKAYKSPASDELSPLSNNSRNPKPHLNAKPPAHSVHFENSFPIAVYKHGTSKSNGVGKKSNDGSMTMMGMHSFSQGSNFKLFKACNFCRRRKIKCIKLSGLAVCEKCNELKQECVFDHKPMLDKNDGEKAKDRRNSVLNLHHKKRKTEVIGDTIGFEESGDLADFDTTFGLPETNGEYEMYVPPKDLRQIETAPSTKSARESMLQVYIDNVEPYTPFVPIEIFNPQNYDELSKLAKCCINIAAASSPSTSIPESTTELFLDIVRDLILANEGNGSFVDMSCMLLLPLRTRIDKEIIVKNLIAFKPILEEKDFHISPNVNLGLITIDAFNSLLTSAPLLIDSRALKNTSNYLKTLDNDLFSNHFLSIGAFTYKFLWLASPASNKLTSEEKKYELIHLEYDMLLWPAKLTQKFYVVKDNLLATPEAFILHVLHNTLLIAFYRNAVLNKSTYGKMSSVVAMPGLYHFISGMAKSTFKVKSSVVGRWSIISDCQIITARYLLDLYEEMEFEDFKRSLEWFKVEDPTNSNYRDLFPTVFDDVKTLLNGETYAEDPDGAVVFWVFRDVRSMSLEVYLHDEKYRRGSGVDADSMYVS